MKPAVAIALIVCGVVLFCVPAVSDHLIVHQIILLQAFQAVADTSNGTLDTDAVCITDSYRAGCFFLGVAMIVLAVIGSWGKRVGPRDTPPENPATP